MVFILYKLYILSPYTAPIPKPNHHRRHSAILHFQKTSLSLIYKLVSSWGPKNVPTRTRILDIAILVGTFCPHNVGFTWTTHTNIHTHTYTHTHARTHARTQTRTHAHTHARTHAHTHTHTDTQTHTQTQRHTDTHAHTHTHTHARTHTHTHPHTHTHARTHAHTHTHTLYEVTMLHLYISVLLCKSFFTFGCACCVSCSAWNHMFLVSDLVRHDTSWFYKRVSLPGLQR